MGIWEWLCVGGGGQIGHGRRSHREHLRSVCRRACEAWSSQREEARAADAAAQASLAIAPVAQDAGQEAGPASQSSAGPWDCGLQRRVLIGRVDQWAGLGPLPL